MIAYLLLKFDLGRSPPLRIIRYKIAPEKRRENILNLP